MAELNLPDIQPPVAFNPFKHHFGFLKACIRDWKELSWNEAENYMLLIGTNLMDFYTGALSVEEICCQNLRFAKKYNISSPEKLKEWLYPFEYRKIKLNDNSEWVIRQGMNTERFLHIHPAKYSPHTIRIRGATLKTVVALCLAGELVRDSILQLSEVNRIRIEKLDLSPVKNLQKGKGILRIWELFNNEISY